MKRNPKLITIIFAAMLVSLIAATPLFSAPSQTAYTTLNQINSSSESTSWFDQTHGRLASNMIMLSLLNTDGSFLPSGIFSFTHTQQIHFGVYYPKLIEFNDTNQNGMFDKGDHILKNVSLDEFVWSSQPSFNSDLVILPIIGIKPMTVIVFELHLYLTTKTVPLSGNYPYINITVPGEKTVKTFVKLRGYSWQPESGDYPYTHRMLALEISLKSSVKPSDEPHLFQLANGTLINSSTSMSDTEPVPLGPNTNISSISLVNLDNITRGGLYWFNNATKNEILIPLNSSFITNGTAFNLFLAVPYFNSSYTLVLDPAFSMDNPPPPEGTGELLQSLLLLLPYLQTSTGLLPFVFGGIVAVAVAAGVVCLLRRKRT